LSVGRVVKRLDADVVIVQGMMCFVYVVQNASLALAGPTISHSFTVRIFSTTALYCSACSSGFAGTDRVRPVVLVLETVWRLNNDGLVDAVACEGNDVGFAVV